MALDKKYVSGSVLLGPARSSTSEKDRAISGLAVASTGANELARINLDKPVLCRGECLANPKCGAWSHIDTAAAASDASERSAPTGERNLSANERAQIRNTANTCVQFANASPNGSPAKFRLEGLKGVTTGIVQVAPAAQVAATPAAQIPAAAPRTSSWLVDTRFLIYSDKISETKQTSADICRDICLKNPDCKGWTFNTTARVLPGAFPKVCFLSTGTGTGMVAEAGSIAGIISGGATAALTAPAAGYSASCQCSSKRCRGACRTQPGHRVSAATGRNRRSWPPRRACHRQLGLQGSSRASESATRCGCCRGSVAASRFSVGHARQRSYA